MQKPDLFLVDHFYIYESNPENVMSFTYCNLAQNIYECCALNSERNSYMQRLYIFTQNLVKFVATADFYLMIVPKFPHNYYANLSELTYFCSR